MTEARLSDFGERRLVNEVLAARYGNNNPQFGDDAAIVTSLGPTTVVATTDPAPIPVAWQLGFQDYAHWGWLLAAINLSDLAAAGARPLGLLTSLTLPSDMKLADFSRLLDGVDECCEANGTRVIGGNLKEDPVPRCEATAIGLVSGSAPLSRQGGRPGDVLVSLGPTGLFWAAVIALEERMDLDPEIYDALVQVLTRPKPQVSAGSRLHNERLVNACTDASDGLYGAMCGLSSDQGLGLVIDPSSFDYLAPVKLVATVLNVDPFRLALGFGNLELVCASPPAQLNQLESVAADLGGHLTILGRLDSERGIRILLNGKEAPLANFDNERFTEESQFTAGLAAFKTRLLEQPLSAPADSTDGT